MSKSIPTSEPAAEATNIRPGKKWYIAGPMRGKDRLNRPAFYEAAVALRKQGHEAVNPFELDMDEDKPIRDYMKVDLPALLDCDGVALLDGWEDSQGARLEALVGFECGLDVRPIYCAKWHGYLDPYKAQLGLGMGEVHCLVTRDDVLKAYGMPDGLSKKDAAAVEETMRKMVSDKLKPGAQIKRPFYDTPGVSIMDNLIKRGLVNTNADNSGNPRESILTEAERLTNGARQADYGHPEEDFTKVAGMLNALFAHKLKDGESFDATDWPLMMNAAKMAREVNRPKRDNRVDGAGYWNTLDMIHDRREGR